MNQTDGAAYHFYMQQLFFSSPDTRGASVRGAMCVVFRESVCFLFIPRSIYAEFYSSQIYLEKICGSSVPVF